MLSTTLSTEAVTVDGRKENYHELLRVNLVHSMAQEDDQKHSPIDLDIAATTSLHLPKLTWSNYDLPAKKMKLINTGRTVLLNGKWRNSERPSVSNGPLLSDHKFTQMHFHWHAFNKSEGSEHTVEGKRLPLEVHAVHYRSGYQSMKMALDFNDALFVVACFFQLQANDNPSIAPLIAALSEIQHPNTEAVISSAYPLSELMAPFHDDYLVYWGAVTPVRDSYRMLWAVSRQAVGISEDQLSKFQAILSTSGKPMNSHHCQVFPRLDRAVFHVPGSSSCRSTLLPLVVWHEGHRASNKTHHMPDSSRRVSADEPVVSHALQDRLAYKTWMERNVSDNQRDGQAKENSSSRPVQQPIPYSFLRPLRESEDESVPMAIGGTEDSSVVRPVHQPLKEETSFSRPLHHQEEISTPPRQPEENSFSRPVRQQEENSRPDRQPEKKSFSSPVRQSKENSSSRPGYQPETHLFSSPVRQPDANSIPMTLEQREENSRSRPGCQPEAYLFSSPGRQPEENSFSRPVHQPAENRLTSPIGRAEEGNTLTNPTRQPNENSTSKPTVRREENSFSRPVRWPDKDLFSNPTVHTKENPFSNPTVNAQENPYFNPTVHAKENPSSNPIHLPEKISNTKPRSWPTEFSFPIAPRQLDDISPPLPIVRSAKDLVVLSSTEMEHRPIISRLNDSDASSRQGKRVTVVDDGQLKYASKVSAETPKSVDISCVYKRNEGGPGGSGGGQGRPGSATSSQSNELQPSQLEAKLSPQPNIGLSFSLRSDQLICHLKLPDLHQGRFETKLFPPLVYRNHFDVVASEATVSNKEHCVELTLNSGVIPILSGGPLHKGGEYLFVALHSYWLPNQHPTNYKRYGKANEIEIRLLYYLKRIGGLDSGISWPLGFAYVGFFVEPSSRSLDNPHFSELLSSLRMVTSANASCPASSRILRLVHEQVQPKGYMTYNGTFASEPQTDVVVWIIYPDPILISQAQYDEFRRLSLKANTNQALSDEASNKDKTVFRAL